MMNILSYEVSTERVKATSERWRHPPLLRDPAALVGEGMSVVGVSGSYVVNTTPAWLFAGTNLRRAPSWTL